MVHVTGEDMFRALITALKKYSLSLKDCINFASDGANVMVGERTDLWFSVKAENENIFQVKCNCHTCLSVPKSHCQTAVLPKESPVGGAQVVHEECDRVH